MPVTGGALFGNSSGRSQSKNLVEFKAGKMTMKGKMVHPDKRKGLVYVYQSEDSLMHFCWKDRQTGTVEDDLIIFPDDCEFKRVPQCTTGRVYLLKFKSSNRKFFFWVQEPKTDKDEENCRKINEVLNNPPTPGSQRSGGGTPGTDGDIQNLLNNMSQQQLMQLFGGVGQIGGLSSLLGMSRPSTGQSSRPASASSTANTTAASTTGSTTTTTTTSGSSTSATTGSSSTSTPSTAATTAEAGATGTTASEAARPEEGKTPIQLSDLRQFLSRLNVPGRAASGGEGSTQRPDLSTTLTLESLQAILANAELVNNLQQHLPAVRSHDDEDDDDDDDDDEDDDGGAEEMLRSTLTSPQFQQALSMFSAALQSGQLGPVVQQFEVGPEAVSAANQGNMEEFIKALQKKNAKQENEVEGGETKRSKKDDEEKKKDKEEDDEGMSLD